MTTGVVRCRSHHPELEIRCVRTVPHVKHEAANSSGQIMSWVDEAICGAQYPGFGARSLLEDMLCHKSATHRGSSLHCAIDENGMHRRWDETRGAADLISDTDDPLVKGHNAGKALAIGVTYFSDYFTAMAVGMREALESSGFRIPIPADGPSPAPAERAESKGEDLLLLDSNGNAWINLDHDSWVRAEPLDRSHRAITREQIEAKGAVPLIEYVRRTP